MSDEIKATIEQTAMSADDRNLILGALDSLATALTEHGHEWTDGERTIYEEAVRLLKGNQ